MKNANEPAFAFTDNRSSDYADNECHYGLTKREYFAAIAMQGILASNWVGSEQDGKIYGHEEVANAAVILADEILKKLES